MQNNSKIELKNMMSNLYIGIFYASFLVSIPMFFANLEGMSGTKLMPVFWYLMTICLFLTPIVYLSRIMISISFNKEEMIIRKWKYAYSVESVIQFKDVEKLDVYYDVFTKSQLLIILKDLKVFKVDVQDLVLTDGELEEVSLSQYASSDPKLLNALRIAKTISVRGAVLFSSKLVN